MNDCMEMLALPRSMTLGLPFPFRQIAIEHVNRSDTDYHSLIRLYRISSISL
jgi:hypothetical protein